MGGGKGAGHPLHMSLVASGRGKGLALDIFSDNQEMLYFSRYSRNFSS